MSFQLLNIEIGSSSSVNPVASLHVSKCTSLQLTSDAVKENVDEGDNVGRVRDHTINKRALFVHHRPSSASFSIIQHTSLLSPPMPSPFLSTFRHLRHRASSDLRIIITTLFPSPLSTPPTTPPPPPLANPHRVRAILSGHRPPR